MSKNEIDTERFDDIIQETYINIKNLHQYSIEEYNESRKIKLVEVEGSSNIEDQKTLSHIKSEKLKLVADSIKQHIELLKVIERKVKITTVKDDETIENKNVPINNDEMKAIKEMINNNKEVEINIS